MRSVVEINGHSIWSPALGKGAKVLDLGANKGGFAAAVQSKYGAVPYCVEANPVLAQELKRNGFPTLSCAVFAKSGARSFNVGRNDESSSLVTPRAVRTHLCIERTETVCCKTLPEVLGEFGIHRVDVVKMDIEGSEVEVFLSLKPEELLGCPQWTVEFHDAPEFGLTTPEEVNKVVRKMKDIGFCVLVGNWPQRTNVLFVNTHALGISCSTWFSAVFRYQWLRFLWRKVNKMP